MKEGSFYSSREKVYRKYSQPSIIEDIINTLVGIDHTNGTWGWVSYKEIEEFIDIDISPTKKFSFRGNGNTMFNKDRGVGKKYELEKDNHAGKVRSLGWRNHTDSSKDNSIPKNIRRYYKNKPCIICGSHNDTVIDHKDKHEKVGSTDINDYQSLCIKCNTLKRSICNKCYNSKQRYNATERGLPVGWVEGTIDYSHSTIGCKGCYYHDPFYFNSRLSVLPKFLTGVIDSNKDNKLIKKSKENLNLFI